MKLTGKNFYTIFVDVWSFDGLGPIPWDELGEYHQACYEAIARQINESHIAPLQGLVREYQSLTENVSEELDPEWFELRAQADKHASLLLGEEEVKA